MLDDRVGKNQDATASACENYYNLRALACAHSLLTIHAIPSILPVQVDSRDQEPNQTNDYLDYYF